MESNKKLVFIVEDDPDICELIETVLTGQNFKVKIFADGKKIEAEIKKQKPNLIIMDLWMPGFDGAKITKTLKSKSNTKKIPIILVSAKNSLEKIAKQAQADSFLAKPFNIRDLIDIIKKFIK